MINKQIITLIFTLLTVTPAMSSVGGLFVEPMLTYESGDATVNFPSPFGSSDSTVKGLGVGARMGVHVIETVFVAGDLRYSFPTYKNSSTSISTDATAYNYGLVVGVQMPTPVALRVWAGYILGGAMDPDSNRGIDVKFVNGDGFRFGAGFQVAMVSLNLEYQHMNYGETEIENGGLFTGPTNNIQQDNDSLIFGVSFPVTL
jgi:Outer membrane protein beta-barrel domain